MIRRADTRTFVCTGLAIGLLTWPVPALATDAIYCITCKNPDEVYRCQVTGVGTRFNDALKLYCVVRTAKEGNHASCSAKRNAGDCAGVAKVYNYDGPAIPPEVADDPRVQGLVDRVAREQDAFDAPKVKGPKTMVEVGRNAVSASRKGWRKARSALGGGSSEADEPAPLPPATENPPSAESMAAADETADRPNRVQRAGAAVGGFARKSYRCMRSLFRDCRDETVGAEATQ